MKIYKKYAESAEIPTASMADIAFLLIIFFMLTTVFAATKGLNVKLPKEVDKTPQQIESVYIKVLPDSSIVVDGREMPVGRILDYLRPKLKRNPDKPVIIHTHPEAPYSAMINVYDELMMSEEKIGIKVKNISIPTQSEIEEYIRFFGFNPFEIFATGE